MPVAKMQYIWERFRNVDHDMGYIGVFEKPDTELIKMLVDHYTDEPVVLEASAALMEKRRAVMENDGQQYQEYKQKDLSDFAPEGYRGSTRVGRAYTNSLFQRLPARILNTIYKGTHVGLDISSSFSTMLVNAFRDIDLHFFSHYSHSPDAVYNHFQAFGLDRATVKKLVNGTICSWPSVYEDERHGNFTELARDQMVIWLREDVAAMASAFKTRYPDFMQMIRRKCEGEDRLEHVEGTGLFYLASDMEHSVMRTVIEHIFGKTQLSDVVWKYDGIIIPMAKISGRRHEGVIDELERVVSEKLDLDVSFKVEDLSAKSFGICIAPEDRNREDGADAYERWKVRFERKFAVLESPPVFMMFGRGGQQWTDLKKVDFDHVTMTENKEFIKRWHEDPNKRLYHRRDFVPPPLRVDEGCMNTYKGIAAAELPPVEGVDIGLYMKHVDILVGNMNGEHPDYADYLHKLLAYKFQNPGLKWRVMPVILSAQGVGKDVWFDFISDLMGDYNCVKGNGIADFVEKKSGKLEGKLLCCFQEMGNRKVDKEWEENLKTYITNRYLTVERKHVNEIIVTNVVDLIGFSNKPDAINISSDDRRFFIVSADSTYMQKTEYIYPLLAFFHDDRNKRAVYDFYMQMDLTGFDPSGDRPKTDTQREMTENQVSHVELFLLDALKVFKDAWRVHERLDVPYNKRDYVMEGPLLRVSTKVVMEQWMEYGKTNGFKNHENKNSMSQFFNKLLKETLLRSDAFKSGGVEKLVQKQKVGNQMFHFFDHRGIQRYLDSIMGGVEEEQPPTKRARHAEYNPSRTTMYQVREDGEVVFYSDDLEEINKKLGEAYIDEERRVLVNPHTGKEFELREWFEGDHRYARVEARFPFYVRDRT